MSPGEAEGTVMVQMQGRLLRRDRHRTNGMELGVQGHIKHLWPVDFTRSTKAIWGKKNPINK